MQNQSQQTPSPGPSEPRQRVPQSRGVEVPTMITVAHLAELITVSPIEVMKQLMRAGVMASINEVIDFDTANAIIPAFGYHATPLKENTKKVDTGIAEVADEDPSLLQPRPPVVTVLGHVDHGKTSLLDAIRKTKVAEAEAGGITQHIGAYQAEYNGQAITFLDTPGHQAFTAMRARGANATDIAVLVVAADDGIMPQTIEAINHVKAAGVPLLVAINKMDRPDADPDRIKRQLSEQELLIEEWGGDIIAIPISATLGTGIDELLENILVVSEVTEFRANPSRSARGVVIEAKLDRSRGPLATVLVKTGTLTIGDHLVAGTIRGRVKALIDDTGVRTQQAGPSMPVEILGLNELPTAGDTFIVVSTDQEAKTIVGERLRNQDNIRQHVSLEDVVSRIRTGESKELNLIIKADVQGSTEAVRDSVSLLSTDKTQVRIVHAASGAVTETDVFLAVTSGSIILGFNTGMEQGARRLAEVEGVEIRFYNIIYTLVEDVQRIVEGLLEPTTQEITEGLAEVREVFSRGRQIKVAGCLVTEGRVVRNAMVRLWRSNNIVHDGPIGSLRRFQEDVRQVSAGTECGIVLVSFNDLQQGDILEIYRQEQVRR